MSHWVPRVRKASQGFSWPILSPQPTSENSIKLIQKPKLYKISCSIQVLRNLSLERLKGSLGLQPPGGISTGNEQALLEFWDKLSIERILE